MLITRNFPPLTGGMERLMEHMALGLSSQAELTIVGPKGCGKYSPTGTQVCETSPSLVPFILFSLWHGIRRCSETDFKLIIGGSGLTAPTLVLLRLLFRAKTMVFVHGLDLVVNSLIYQKLFIPAIRSIDCVIANSRNTAEIATQKGVDPSRITIINPGTTIPIPGSIETRNAFLKRHDIPFEKVILFAGRITRRKGLSRFIQSCLPSIVASAPEAGLIVVGENPDQGLTNLGEGKEIIELVDKLHLSTKVRFLGQLDDSELLASFAAADVHVLPLIDVAGDIEGFGMVAIEAAACGTPTVGFSVGGVTDAISPMNGELIEPERHDLLAAAIIARLRNNSSDEQACIEHARNFRWEVYNDKISKVIQSML